MEADSRPAVGFYCIVIMVGVLLVFSDTNNFGSEAVRQRETKKSC